MGFPWSPRLLVFDSWAPCQLHKKVGGKKKKKGRKKERERKTFIHVSGFRLWNKSEKVFSHVKHNYKNTASPAA